MFLMSFFCICDKLWFALERGLWTYLFFSIWGRLLLAYFSTITYSKYEYQRFKHRVGAQNSEEQLTGTRSGYLATMSRDSSILWSEENNFKRFTYQPRPDSKNNNKQKEQRFCLKNPNTPNVNSSLNVFVRPIAVCRSFFPTLFVSVRLWLSEIGSRNKKKKRKECRKRNATADEMILLLGFIFSFAF